MLLSRARRQQRCLLGERFLHRFEVGGFSELYAVQRGIDIAAKPKQDRARTDLDKSRHTLTTQFPNGIRPADRVRDLLVEPLAGVATSCNFAGLPVVDQGKLKVSKLNCI